MFSSLNRPSFFKEKSGHTGFFNLAAHEIVISGIGSIIAGERSRLREHAACSPLKTHLFCPLLSPLSF